MGLVRPFALLFSLTRHRFGECRAHFLDHTRAMCTNSQEINVHLIYRFRLSAKLDPMPFLPDAICEDNVLPFARRRATTRLSKPNRPVLIVLHQEQSTPGRVGNLLRVLGYPLDIRRPRLGDPLPKTLDDHAASVIFGGPMSANDGDDYMRREIN